MTRRIIDHYLSVQPLVRALVTNPAVLCLGVSGDPDHLRYVLTTRNNDGRAAPVAWGTGIPVWLRLLMPVVAHVDTGFLPVHLITEMIGNEDPDTWIDRNEARIIPTGFTADQIDTDWIVDGAEVVAFSAVAEARNDLCRALERHVTVGMLLPPLSGFAAAYRSAISGVWVLWKVDTRGSILGRIVEGKVHDVCHFWADTDSVRADPMAVAEAVFPLLHSLGSDSDAPLRVLMLDTGDQPPVEIGPYLPECQLIPRPAVPGLPPAFHEAYGNAGESLPVTQLLPFHQRQKAKALHRRWRTLWVGVRSVVVVLIILFVAGGSYIGLGRFLMHRDRAAMRDVDKKYTSLVRAEGIRDSLMSHFRERAAFIAGESSLTLLLNDLQEVFPEGVRAEEISVTEHDTTSWNLVIRALTRSSSLMQPTIGNLGKVKGVHDVRIVYSEQGGGNRQEKDITFRIDAVWRR